MSRYKASPMLEAYILRHAPTFITVDEGAPSNLDELRAAVAGGRPIPVWSGGSDLTMYSAPEVNHAARAWHDSLHLKLNAEFNAMGEAMVASESCRLLRLGGLSFESQDAMHLDTWGQFLYSVYHDGKFPNDQAAFIACAFRDFRYATVFRTF